MLLLTLLYYFCYFFIIISIAILSFPELSIGLGVWQAPSEFIMSEKMNPTEKPGLLIPSSKSSLHIAWPCAFQYCAAPWLS